MSQRTTRAKRVFLCVLHSLISMVGWAGASSGAPVPCDAGKTNSVQLTTSLVGLSGGEDPSHRRFIMATKLHPSADRIFKFDTAKQLRMFSIDGNPWFAAQDVCDALSLTNARMSLKALDSDEKGVSSTYTPGGAQTINVISESGLYTLILRCRDAVTPGTTPYRFRKWVTCEVLPSIRQTGAYSHQQQESLTAEPQTTMNVRDARRGKKVTDKRAAERIAEVCVPVIMKEMRDHQYHYSNCKVGPEEVIPALMSENLKGLQLHALLVELADNNHDVSGAHRELEAIRYYLKQQRKKMSEIVTHCDFISQMALK